MTVHLPIDSLLKSCLFQGEILELSVTLHMCFNPFFVGFF